MKEQFVTYEIALALKELGFDKEVIATFDTDELSDNRELKIFAFAVPNKGIFEEGFKRGWCIKAPLWQQAIDWFREKYDINILIHACTEGFRKFWQYEIKDITSLSILEMTGYQFYSYEEVREQAILKAIELCKENQKNTSLIIGLVGE